MPTFSDIHSADCSVPIRRDGRTGALSRREAVHQTGIPHIHLISAQLNIRRHRVLGLIGLLKILRCIL